VEKDERTRYIESEGIAKLQKDQGDEIAIITQSVKYRLKEILIGRKVIDIPEHITSRRYLLERGLEITSEIVMQLPLDHWRNVVFDDPEIEDRVDRLLDSYDKQIQQVNDLFEDKINRLRKVDELPPGVIKMVKVFIAMKRKLAVGDKMAGRHGNKGVVSRIMPEEDMPYFVDGTPVDIVLNPLGVPSRMNVGQVLETHLGWASQLLGQQIGKLIKDFYDLDAIKNRIRAVYQNPKMEEWLVSASYDDLKKFWEKYNKDGIYMASPVFDGALESEIRNCLNLAGVSEVGKAKLYDGRTGEPFDRTVTVGAMYMMKLHHLVDDKIHARSIGPYSLVTQQPLGGKAQFGGQRLGEMEVWAMEAYGAAYSLQEFLTVKSDDVAGRTRMYEKIVKGQYDLEAGLPESFNVLIRELQSLGLNVELLEDKEAEGSETNG
jgi:DNA-directed RNA polymerase subunit beta